MSVREILERALASGEVTLGFLDRANLYERAIKEALAALDAEGVGLREPLEWYAEQARDCRKMGRDGDRARQALDADGGARALAALNADEEGGHGQ